MSKNKLLVLLFVLILLSCKSTSSLKSDPYDEPYIEPGSQIDLLKYHVRIYPDTTYNN